MSVKDQFDLSNKVAVVTGAVGILGRRFCGALAEFGASVVVADVDSDACAGFAEELRETYGRPALGVACDVGSEESVRDLFSRVNETFGAVHILHNNAATKTTNLDTFLASFEDYTLETWREVIRVNLDGMFLMAQAAGKMMIEKQVRGSIIQTASIYGILGPDQRIYNGSEYNNRPMSSPAVYSASKAGVVGLTKYLATYWAEKGIRVNTLTPGGVESGQNSIFQENYSRRIPMGRMANREEMLGALVFLASDASSYVTGQNIIIDGGLTAW